MAETIRDTTELGRLVRAERKRQGLRQEDLALAAGTGRRFIVDLENGKSSVRLEQVLAVLNCLGLTVRIGP